MFKEIYNKIYDQISPSEHLVSATLASQRISRKAQKNFKPIYRKPMFAYIAIAICLMLAVPAFGVNSPVIYELMYKVSPSVAQFFKPIQKNCENNGIKMEVVSTYIHDNTAEIYVTLQDLTGNRIDATTDLYDSYSINRPFASMARCELIGFNETTKTATFLISITEYGNRNISGDKITFSLKEFISGKHIYDGIRVDTDLSNISDTPSTMPMPNKNGWGGDYDFQNLGNPIVLAHSSPISFGVDGIDITGMGYINGMLHIQTLTGSISTSDNHGYFYFKDKSGNNIYFKNKNGYNIPYVYSVSFNEYQNGELVQYNEIVYDIPQSGLYQYELYGYFVTGKINADTVGPWQVTFPIE